MRCTRASPVRCNDLDFGGQPPGLHSLLLRVCEAELLLSYSRTCWIGGQVNDELRCLSAALPMAASLREYIRQLLRARINSWVAALLLLSVCLIVMCFRLSV